MVNVNNVISNAKLVPAQRTTVLDAKQDWIDQHKYQIVNVIPTILQLRIQLIAKYAPLNVQAVRILPKIVHLV